MIPTRLANDVKSGKSFTAFTARLPQLFVCVAITLCLLALLQLLGECSEKLAPAIGSRVLGAERVKGLHVSRKDRGAAASRWRLHLWLWLWLPQAFELLLDLFEVRPIALQLLNGVFVLLAISVHVDLPQLQNDLLNSRIRGAKGARNVFAHMIERQRAVHGALADSRPRGELFH
jgi:hypothetical protein